MNCECCCVSVLFVSVLRTTFQQSKITIHDFTTSAPPHETPSPHPHAHLSTHARKRLNMWTPNTGTGQRVLAPLLLAAMSAHVFAHPSAIGGGRGSCGAEYDTPDKAYYLPDISESWYLRRIATCDKPVFWQRFGARFCPSRSLLCCARPGQTSAAMTMRAKQRAPGKEELCRPPLPLSPRLLTARRPASGVAGLVHGWMRRARKKNRGLVFGGCECSFPQTLPALAVC